MTYKGNYLIGQWDNSIKGFYVFGVEEYYKRDEVSVLGFVKQQPRSNIPYTDVDIRQPINKELDDIEIVRVITYRGNPDWLETVLSLSLPDGKRTLPHGSITVETK